MGNRLWISSLCRRYERSDIFFSYGEVPAKSSSPNLDSTSVALAHVTFLERHCAHAITHPTLWNMLDGQDLLQKEGLESVRLYTIALQKDREISFLKVSSSSLPGVLASTDCV